MRSSAIASENANYNPDVRQVLRVLWMSLVLLIVALTSALIAMQLAIHGREVQVPDFRGKTPAEARQMAENAGVTARLEREYYSDSVPEGRVLSQVPEVDATVRRGWDVSLALSLGPQRVTIPEVVGESQRAAVITIDERGLDVASTASVPLADVAAGQVIGQDPPANANYVSSPKINLLIAGDSTLDAYVTPSFIGQPLGTVTNVLKDAGFSVGKVTTAPLAVSPNGVPQNGGLQNVAQNPAAQTGALEPAPAIPSAASIIVAQDPAPGQKIIAASAINFVVR